MAVYRPSAGTWFWLKSTAGNLDYGYRGWGVQAAGDEPVPGDYDGDGVTDSAVFRLTTGEWFIRPANGNSPWNVVFGTTGDKPLQAVR